MRVKVCGIRRVEDALLAARAGADAIGLLVGQVHASDDFLTPDTAAQIARACPPYVTPVMVTHLTDPNEIAALTSYIRVPAIQLHSDCTPSAMPELRALLPGVKLIKSVHANSPDPMSDAMRFADLADGLILDTVIVAEDRVGGTGLPHDWAVSRRIVDELSVPVILAGGLDATNVAEAITVVRPFGVDANSRLKSRDGFKDPAKVRAFVREAKQTFFAVAGAWPM